MGVLNITPDSFSDGGKFFQGDTVVLDAVRDQALAMIADGAVALDIGGESSRPGAQAVSPEEEQRRGCPYLKRCLISRSFCLLTPIIQRQSAQLSIMAWV